MAKKSKEIQWPEVIAFRLSDGDRQTLEKLTKALGTTKSDFLRKRVKHILLTLKNVEDENFNLCEPARTFNKPADGRN